VAPVPATDSSPLRIDVFAHRTFVGIGENGHVAFNDPHVADFDDPVAVKRVGVAVVAGLCQRELPRACAGCTGRNGRVFVVLRMAARVSAPLFPSPVSEKGRATISSDRALLRRC